MGLDFFFVKVNSKFTIIDKKILIRYSVGNSKCSFLNRSGNFVSVGIGSKRAIKESFFFKCFSVSLRTKKNIKKKQQGLIFLVRVISLKK